MNLVTCFRVFLNNSYQRNLIVTEEINYNIIYPFPFEQCSVLFSSKITTCQLHTESQCGTELYYSIESNSIVITPLFLSFNNSII